MTAEKPAHAPWWMHGLTLLVVAALLFVATTLRDTALNLQKLQDRVDALEGEQIIILKEQQTNSSARIELEIEMKHIQKTTDDNNRLLLEHMQRSR